MSALGGKINQKELIMRNEANFPKSQMFITLIRTTNYNKKWTMDTWSKRTQTNPIYSELACTEQGRSVESILPASSRIHPSINPPLLKNLTLCQITSYEKQTPQIQLNSSNLAHHWRYFESISRQLALIRDKTRKPCNRQIPPNKFILPFDPANNIILQVF